MSNAIDTVEETRQSSLLEVDGSQRIPTHSFKIRESKPERKPIPRWAYASIPVALVLLSATLWWLHARHFETTDDAQVDGHINVVSSRITGTVVYVNPRVENDQYVEAGTLLVELDPNDYQAELDHARADLATREASARSANVNVPITNASAFSQLTLAEAAVDEADAALEHLVARLREPDRSVDHTSRPRRLEGVHESLKTRSAFSRRNFGHTSSRNGTSGISPQMRSSDRPIG